jgi:uncharacterized protein (TIGR03067 family)
MHHIACSPFLAAGGLMQRFLTGEEAVMFRVKLPQALMSLIFVCLGLGLLFSQEAPTAPGSLKELQGEWQIVKARKGNKDANPEEIAQMKVVVTEKGLKVVEPNFTETVEILKVSPGQGLSQIDLALAKANGKVLEGIFTRQGDKLLFAWSKNPEKGKRPANFETRGDTVVYMELARPKKGDAKAQKEAPSPPVPMRTAPNPNPAP